MRGGYVVWGIVSRQVGRCIRGGGESKRGVEGKGVERTRAGRQPGGGEVGVEDEGAENSCTYIIGLDLEFCAFIVGERHAFRSVWPFILPFIVSTGIIRAEKQAGGREG